MNNLEKITDKIRSDAESFRQVAQAQAEHRLSDLREKYDSDRDYLRAQAAQAARHVREEVLLRAESAAETEKRRILLAAKTDMIDRAYRQAEEQLLALQGNERVSFLAGLIADALRAHLDDCAAHAALYGDAAAPDADVYSVRLSQKDRDAYGDQILSYLRSHHEALGETTLARLRMEECGGDFSGGVLLRFGDIEVNCTLDMLLSRHREAGGEAAVYRILFPA